jgi:hypothetical protein
LENSIVTAFAIIAAVICAALVFNAIYPAVVRSSDAMTSMGHRMDERMRSQVRIIHAGGELDSSQTWQDGNGDGDFDVHLWVKNTGSLRVAAVESCDLFFGPEGNFQRIPHRSMAEGSTPYWTWEIENDSEWNPTATCKITIHFTSVLSSQRYFARIVLPNGVSDDYYFSM